jgi:3-deoxy-7-phosphoheptulonate synthase
MQETASPELNQYQSEGYAIFRGVLDADLIHEASDHVDWLREKNPGLRPEQLHNNLMTDDPFWVRLISDPRLDGSCDIPEGLPLARQVLLRIGATGLPCGTEFLDPIVPQYVSDLVSWAAIGARTIESQTHRQMASGLSMPIGFKNGTDGSLPDAINGLLSAREPHAFLGIDADGVTSVVKTTGNPDGHLVLRGGRGKSNYHAADIASAAELCVAHGIARGVMIDCSHDNSGKDHTKQAAIFRQVVRAFRDGQSAILGLMIESNLQPGKQTWTEGKDLARGVSITDSCIGWDETEALLTMAAEDLAHRASACFPA